MESDCLRDQIHIVWFRTQRKILTVRAEQRVLDSPSPPPPRARTCSNFRNTNVLFIRGH